MKPGRKSRPPQRSATGTHRTKWFAGVCLAVASAGALLWATLGHRSKPPPLPTGAVLEDERAAFSQYGGSASCRECHKEAYDLWAKSNHGLAERPLRSDPDAEAFFPARTFKHGSQESELRSRGGGFEVVTLGYASNREAYQVERVIGNDPLQQFLVPAPGGRLQTLEASWDPHKKEWFNVYGAEDRVPGEWGHWTGRGMNWNNMCAFCHNTRLRKNYHAATDTYRTTMVEMGVGCETCHGPMKAHVQWRRSFPNVKTPDPTVRKILREEYFDACAACHARRIEVTGDFKPGEAFFDHYALVTVDTTDTYYPDGQVRDENYEFAAFLGSKMHAAGVRCMDCHQPHSAKRLLPGNELCMRCHNGKDITYTNSPVIDPVAHSFHPKPDSTGNLCTTCHMPITPYMQRHPRHDHGFTIPDPLLTKQHGIPNACNRCHTDKDVDWSIEYCDKWYGKKMDRPSRKRTQTIAAARKGEDTAREPLLEMLQGQETPYWKTVAIRMLERWLADAKVTQSVLEQVKHTNAMVRAAAARALEGAAAAGRADARAAIEGLWTDPVRSVRVAAAWALRGSVDLESKAGREMAHMMDWQADQPGGQLQKGVLALARQDLTNALGHFQKAVTWDPNSAPLHHELAVALSMAGRSQEALVHIQQATRLEPKEAEYQYKLALAWNEVGSLDKAAEALEKTVSLDPRHARAWYNLGLARNSQGRTDEALKALQQAESAEPADARIPYARATILARLARTAEARAAAQRALELQRNFPEAEHLLQTLPR
jgi:tetratricopeptide (TPR) repeat protein